MRLMDYLGLQPGGGRRPDGGGPHHGPADLRPGPAEAGSVFLVEGRPLHIGGGSYALCPQRELPGLRQALRRRMCLPKKERKRHT